jgi:hypothetical protein
MRSRADNHTRSPLQIYDSDLVRMLCYDAIMSITPLSIFCQDLFGISQNFYERLVSETSKQPKNPATPKTSSTQTGNRKAFATKCYCS